MAATNIREVAKHAGVSIATVSHVINNTRYVKEETRKKVLKSIEELDYHPNAAARSFKTGRHNLIAVIVPDIASPYFSSVIESIENVISPYGYQPIICSTKGDTAKEEESLRLLSNGMVDGFIIASEFSSYKTIAKIIPSDTPVVLIDRTLKDSTCDTILIGTYQAMCQGVEYLISKGHKRIALMEVKGHISTTEERIAAYLDTMKKHNLSTDGLIFTANSLGRAISNNTTELLKANVTALVTFNNAMTTEALVLLTQNDQFFGNNIELIGFKESEQPQYFQPGTNLICQPSEELGRNAGLRMLERLQNPDSPIQQVVLSATFVPGEKAFFV